MGYRSITVALVLGLVSLPLSCGGDDDDTTSTPSSGKGGTAGKSTGGKAGTTTGGKAGSSTTAGKAGKGGSAGSGAVGGSATGGRAGTGGHAGTSTGGHAGTSIGGQAGAGTGNNGGQGGESQAGTSNGGGGATGLDTSALDAAIAVACTRQLPAEGGAGGGGGIGGAGADLVPCEDTTGYCPVVYGTNNPDPDQGCVDATAAHVECLNQQPADGFYCSTDGYGPLPIIGGDATDACGNFAQAQDAACQ